MKNNYTQCMEVLDYPPYNPSKKRKKKKINQKQQAATMNEVK